MADILLDAKFWNKVFKEMKHQTVIVIKKNKGKGKLIPANAVMRASKAKIDEGFFYKFMYKNYDPAKRSVVAGKLAELKDRKWKAYVWDMKLTQLRIKEIEKAIITTAIKEFLLPESILYNGKTLIRAGRVSSKRSISRGFVYFIRNNDIYKIGITDNLLRRIRELRPDEVMNVVRCANFQELEKKLHMKFKTGRIPQTEYFRLSKEQVHQVHKLMMELASF
ncbi:NADH-ubiquinone oxidoreductase [cyanobiont of Ornithocercus magnificus]|nr:NADH-ubiquinone oxidoreductase [cyanobiont of Ornithocercus magnificus]